MFIVKVIKCQLLVACIYLWQELYYIILLHSKNPHDILENSFLSTKSLFFLSCICVHRAKTWEHCL